MSSTSTQNCTSISTECPVSATVYGYYPDLAANAFFCAYFATFTIAQLVLGYRAKTWTFASFCFLGCLSEMIGYIGRLIMHSNPWSNVGFEMQICTLIFAPSFFAAAIYMLLKHIVRVVGPQFSPIKAILYPWIFMSCDFFSLLLQAIGGGVAASASKPSTSALGGNIMLAGIVFQVVTFTFLYGLIISIALNIKRDSSSMSTEAAELLHSKDFKIFAVGIFAASIAIYSRCVYRIAELAGSWANPIMRDEASFIVLDGVMCALAALALTVFHPGFFFKPMVRRSPAIQEKQVESETSEIEV